MELRTLSYFLAVARAQNMTEAANVLHVTQPTLSRQIADLEDELGKKLFTRTSRSTVLTEDGMHLRQRAEEILALVEQTEDEIKSDAIDLTGSVRIGAGETHALHLLAELFADLHSRYPRLTVELFTGNADTVEEKLAHGLIDFAVMIEPFPLEDYNFIRLPEPIRAGIVTRVDSKWGQLPAVHPEDLAEMPLFLSSRQKTESLDFSAWSGGKITPEKLHIVGHHDLIGNVSHFVQAGVGCAYAIDQLLQTQAMGLKFIPFEPAITLSAVVVWKKYRLLSKSAEVFLKELTERVQGEKPSD